MTASAAGPEYPDLRQFRRCPACPPISSSPANVFFLAYQERSRTSIGTVTHSRNATSAANVSPTSLAVKGYGSALLASAAATVVGVDIASDAIAHARSHYAGLANACFKQGSVDALPLPDASVDVVVSFETVEHLPREEQPRMLAEFARVLGADGILVLSTPNPIEYSEARNYRNPFHYYELPRVELASLLGPTFPAHHWFRQRRYFGSAIWSEIDGAGFEAWTGDISQVERAEPPAAMYFILVAGRSVESLPHADVALSLFC